MTHFVTGVWAMAPVFAGIAVLWLLAWAIAKHLEHDAADLRQALALAEENRKLQLRVTALQHVAGALAVTVAKDETPPWVEDLIVPQQYDGRA